MRKDGTGLRFDYPSWAIAKLNRFKQENPLADDFQFEGICPVCKHDVLVSYIHDGDYPHTSCCERCGHWCPNCGFSGATTRAIYWDWCF